MRRFSHRVGALLFLCGGGLIASWAAQRPLLAEEHPPRFATVAAQPLPSSQEGVQSLDDILAPFRVICFLGTECPLAKLYGPRLDRLATEMADAGVAFIGINSNPQDSLADIATYVEQHHVRFPVLKDVNQAVAVALGATRTPEVVVIDDTGAVCYRGRIDDQYDPGVARPEPTAHYLADALVELTTGKPVTLAITEPTGCLMQLPDPAGSPEPTTSLTFAKEISRVLQKHCVECHQAGEIGPFALEDYDEVIGWGDMLLMVQEENAPARALYQRLGYREEAVSPHYYGMRRPGMRRPPTGRDPADALACSDGTRACADRRSGKRTTLRRHPTRADRAGAGRRGHLHRQRVQLPSCAARARADEPARSRPSTTGVASANHSHRLRSR